MIGKYLHDPGDSAAQAEEAFRHALDLNPRLAVAHRFYASFEGDTGRSLDALVRLVGEGRRHGNDAELFAGLVHAARYCGLYEQSIAAHEEARRLDPNVITTMEQTLVLTGDLERLLALEGPAHASRGRDLDRAMALGLAGRYDEARRILDDLRAGALLPAWKAWLQAITAWVDRRPESVLAGIQALEGLTIAEDPEGLFQVGWMLSDLGERWRACASCDAPSTAASTRRRRWRRARRSTACARIRRSSRCWHSPRPGARRRWPRIARPAARSCSGCGRRPSIDWTRC